MILPKLRLVDDTKKTILLLSDDLRLHSGIGTMSKEIVLHTAHRYNWFQLGAAIEHPDRGKVFDLSDDVNKEMGISNSNVKVMPWSGYGDPHVLRRLLLEVKPDAILHFTDPRFWGWLYAMEHEVRRQCPLIYYAIWDDTPFPNYNIMAYSSCDMILGISKQSHNIHNNVLLNHRKKVIDIDEQ